MAILEQYESLVEELYNLSNPILKLKIDNELFKKSVVIDQDLIENNLINYWLNIFDGYEIHGSRDSAFENSIGKLLEFGLTKVYKEFDKKFNVMLEDKYWNDDPSFYPLLMKTVIYPFLTRAGYFDEQNISSFFYNRIETIERTIRKYEYEFRDTNLNKPKKYINEFVFKIDTATEWLPTIYDLYAFAFYPNKNDSVWDRIEKIVEYLLDKRFQDIPEKAYIYDNSTKRYYAAGNVYHACILENRKLLFIYLLSHFKVARNSELFINELKKLSTYQIEDGFFEFDKSLILENKNKNFLYNGSHMGLGEDRTKSNWRKFESTFWMLKILVNLE